MRFKKIITFSLFTLTAFSLYTSPSFAESNHTSTTINSQGKTIHFSAPSSFDPTSVEKEVVAISKAHPDADDIIIHKIAPLKALSSSSTEPVDTLSTNFFTPSKHYTTHKILESDRFIESCAKGQTLTIKNLMIETLSPQISGNIPMGYLNLKNKLSFSLTSVQTLSGPPEESDKNSRVYYCKFYQIKGTWLQPCIINETNYSQSGYFTEPIGYIFYSFDLKIH